MQYLDDCKPLLSSNLKFGRFPGLSGAGGKRIGVQTNGCDFHEERQLRSCLPDG